MTITSKKFKELEDKINKSMEGTSSYEPKVWKITVFNDSSQVLARFVVIAADKKQVLSRVKKYVFDGTVKKDDPVKFKISVLENCGNGIFQL